MEAATIAEVSARVIRVEGGGQVKDNDQTPRSGVQRVRKVPRGAGPGTAHRGGLSRFRG
jgi:hypothetical protein